jgi:serine/threonine protein kinase
VSGTNIPEDIEAMRLYALVTEKLFGASDPVQIGRYRVLERIGAGSMGVVYAAVDEQLGRKVALKVLRAGSDATGRARLLREAEALARLRHRHLVQAYDVGTHAPGTASEQVYVAMELVEGRHLDVWLAAAPRGWQEVLAVFVQAGQALAAAHAAGVLHRDFKPQNVLIDGEDNARVLDFGLARALDVGVDPGDSLSTRLTRTGTVLGTPAYMAPEQDRGERVGPAADQYSFCVALYEALYGERPFAGVPRFVPAAGDRVTDVTRVPEDVRRAIVRGLALEPSSRHASMTALLAALAHRRTRGRRLLMLVAAALGSRRSSCGG